MNVLVIGGAGYIGSHVVKDLCDSGFNVTVFDNLSSGYESNVDSRAKLIVGDILDKESLNCAFSSNNFDLVFHFAALKDAGESILKPDKYSEVNIVGSINLITCMDKFGVRNIIFSSTAAVYGKPEYIPIDENHPINPEFYYGFTKFEIENIIKWYSKLKNFNYVILRYFNAAGYGSISGKEKNPTNLFPIVMEVANGTRKNMKIFGSDYKTKDGTCVRDYIHVLDLSDAHIKAAKFLLNNKKSLVLNLSSEKGYSVLEIVKRTEELLGKKINYTVVDRRQGDQELVIASSKLAFETLGWKAKYSDLDNIIKSMWNVYKK